MSKAQQAIWKELVRKAHKDTLTEADSFALEIAVRLIQRMRSGRASISEHSMLISLLARLGMTPVDRCRLEVSRQEEKPENHWDNVA